MYNNNINLFVHHIATDDDDDDATRWLGGEFHAQSVNLFVTLQRKPLTLTWQRTTMVPLLPPPRRHRSPFKGRHMWKRKVSPLNLFYSPWSFLKMCIEKRIKAEIILVLGIGKMFVVILVVVVSWKPIHRANIFLVQLVALSNPRNNKWMWWLSHIAFSAQEDSAWRGRKERGGGCVFWTSARTEWFELIITCIKVSRLGCFSVLSQFSESTSNNWGYI